MASGNEGTAAQRRPRALKKVHWSLEQAVVGLCLLGGLIALLAFDAGNWAVFSLAVVAAVANGEIILLHLLARKPPVDVPSIFHWLKREQKSAQG